MSPPPPPISVATIQKCAIAAIAAQCLVLCFAIAGTHGWLVKLTEVSTTDFASFYAAGKLAAGPDPAAVYDLARHARAEIAATGSGADYKFFFYPPVFLLLLAPLARLPYLAAFIAFEAASLAALLAALHRVIARWTMWAMLAIPSLYWCLGQGQNSLSSAALFVAGLGALDRAPWLAGAAFGLLCYKPHLCLVLPFALIAGRHWRCLAGFVSTITILIAASLSFFGSACWLAYAHRFATAGGVFATSRIHHGALVSLYGAALNLGIAPAAAGGAQLAATIAAIAAVVAIWRQDPPPWRRNASLLAATLIAMPVVLFYDLTIAAPAAMWLATAVRTRRDQSWLLACFLIDLVGYPIALVLHLSIAAMICPMLLLIALRKSAARIFFS